MLYTALTGLQSNILAGVPFTPLIGFQLLSRDHSTDLIGVPYIVLANVP